MSNIRQSGRGRHHHQTSLAGDLADYIFGLANDESNAENLLKANRDTPARLLFQKLINHLEYGKHRVE
jgi:hypothetical protein